MYIGTLKQQKIAFFHAGTDIPFSPSSAENGIYTWNWDYIFDTALDVHVTLEEASFIGAITVGLTKKKSVKKIEILSNGVIVGVYSAETDGATGGEITVSVGTETKTLTVRLYAAMEDLILTNLDVLGARDDETPFVWPQPKKICAEKKVDGIREIVASTADADESFAVEFLKERLTERHGKIPVSESGYRIVFVKDTTGAYNGERYTVKTEDKTVTVTAASRLALLYGADTLLQISSKEGVPSLSVDDKPSKEFRGLHIGLPARENFEFTRRLFRYVLIPLRFNLLIVEFAGGMRFEKHPEISEAWLRAKENFKQGLQPKMPHSGMVAGGTVLEKHEVAEVLGYARELGIEIVPEVQSLGHVQYITYAHPELAERIETPDGDVDTRADDTKPVGFYPHCYCPSLQESYDLMYDIIDEIVEVAKPSRYVHMGHDEIYHLGRCRRCQTKNPADLYVKHVTAMYDYLKQKGLGMMIWSDMLHTDSVRKYYVPEARDRLPKDIVMLDFSWYFHPENDIEDELLPYGYKLLVGNLYSSHHTRYRSRIFKDGMMGGQISLWLSTEESLAGEKGKWWDMMYLSEMLWNAESYDERNRTAYTHLIASYLQPRLRDELRGTYSANGYTEKALSLPNGNNHPFAPLASLAPGAILWTSGEITVNEAFDRLIFEHATAWSAPITAWDNAEQIGAYTVTYEDGKQETVDVCYGRNIMCCSWRYAQPMPHKYYRHTGYCGTWFSDPVCQGHAADGSDLTVTGYVWQNPHPDQKIVSIAYQPAENNPCGLVLVGIRGEIKN
ncbi:MAG: family 20 glycosylhydrolase [Clostridia bacterium]|nr:family 20 glycosylhydrolase [Clostridia bacterium]